MHPRPRRPRKGSALLPAGATAFKHAFPAPWWVCSYSVPPRATVATDGYHFGGCLFTTSSLMSAPQPGFGGQVIRWPFSYARRLSVTRSSFQGTSSMSISMMRKFGIPRRSGRPSAWTGGRRSCAARS